MLALIFSNLVLFSVFSVLPLSSSERTGSSQKPRYKSIKAKDILAELNLAREHPRRYAEILENEKKYFRGNMLKRPGRIALRTAEGVKAFDEAIRYLRKIKPCPPLRASKGMSRAARDHISDQNRTGQFGHKGQDGSWPADRISRYGTWERTMAENISYGSNTARDIIISLIVDDNVPDRGHRKNIFNSEFKVVGIGIGPHRKYRVMCVMDFAAGYIE